jgi:hypothetical protein
MEGSSVMRAAFQLMELVLVIRSNPRKVEE